MKELQGPLLKLQEELSQLSAENSEKQSLARSRLQLVSKDVDQIESSNRDVAR
jgi:hypothetical protein